MRDCACDGRWLDVPGWLGDGLFWRRPLSDKGHQSADNNTVRQGQEDHHLVMWRPLHADARAAFLDLCTPLR